MNDTFEIGLEDIEQIEEFLEDKLSGFLVNNLSDFTHCVFIMQAVVDKIKEVKDYYSNTQEN